MAPTRWRASPATTSSSAKAASARSSSWRRPCSWSGAGAIPTLRVPTTLGALRLLARAGHVPRNAARELGAAYRFLRRVEHRLQMVADRQTHELPQRPEELARFATFMGYPDATAFAAELLHHLRQVRARYAEVFELVPELLTPRRIAGWNSISAASTRRPKRPQQAPARSASTTRKRIVTAVRGWQAGHVRALRSTRARELIAQLLPRMLAALARQPQPDAVFNRFDAFLARQPAGVQLLSLFQRNPGLLDRVAAVLGAAPSLANHLASHPAALDGLLQPGGEPGPGPPAARSRCAMRGCSRTSSRSPAAPCARRISPSPSPRWRVGSTPTRPACAGPRSPMRR